MRRFLCAALFSLLIGGCFESENPHIPRAELVQPDDLFGRHWKFGGSVEDVSVEEFIRGEDGVILLDNGENDGVAGQNQLVPVAGEDGFLLVAASDQPRVNYALMERHADRTWRMSDIEVAGDGWFGDQNEAYAQAVAKRHGLELAFGEGTRIEGNVTADAVLGLMRDPDFLGALNVELLGIYLPSEIGTPREEGFASGGFDYTQIGVAVATGAEIRSVRAAVNGLEGVYLQASGSYSGPARIVVSRQGKGVYSVAGPFGAPSTWTVYPFEEADGRYLVVVGAIHDRGEGKELSQTLHMLWSSDDGWSLHRVLVRPGSALPAMVAMREELLARAARRYGFEWEAGLLKPLKEGGELASLLRDGQFTSGLDVEQGMVDRLYRADAIEKVLAGRQP